MTEKTFVEFHDAKVGGVTSTSDSVRIDFDHVVLFRKAIEYDGYDVFSAKGRIIAYGVLSADPGSSAEGARVLDSNGLPLLIEVPAGDGPKRSVEVDRKLCLFLEKGELTIDCSRAELEFDVPTTSYERFAGELWDEASKGAVLFLSPQ